MTAYTIWKLGHEHQIRGNKIAANIIKWFLRIIYHQDISLSANIGENAIFSHRGLGIVITGRSTIGNNCTIGTNVTIGNISLYPGVTGPKIGNNVYIGNGARILGAVNIGNDVSIAANALVITDVEDSMTFGGVPAKPLQKKIFAADLVHDEEFKGSVSNELRNIFSKKGYGLSSDAKYINYDASHHKKNVGKQLDNIYLIKSENIFYKIKKYGNKLIIYIKYI